MIDINYKQRPEELIVRYKLEPTLKELFVEGEADKAFLLNYIKKRNLNYRVHCIENINTSSFIAAGEINVGKKHLLEKLSVFFEAKMSINNRCLYCICDKDEDKFITIPLVNSYLIYTDFSSLESYAFNEVVLGKILNIFLHKKAPSGKKAVEDIIPAVQFLFSVRLMRYAIDRGWTAVEVSKAISFDKTGKVNFDIKDYVQKFSGNVNNRSVNSMRDYIISCYNAFDLSYLGLDYRLVMHGHDFAKTVNLYQRQIGGQNISDDIFERALLTAIEAEDLDNYPLFQIITGCSD